jgi:hypothetical protein
LDIIVIHWNSLVHRTIPHIKCRFASTALERALELILGEYYGVYGTTEEILPSKVYMS